MVRKHLKRPIVAPQAQHQLAGMADHARGFAHQLLEHRFDAPALGFVAHRRERLVQSVLANQAQQIHRHRSQLAHQIVGVKFARGQKLQIHVGLELRVKLLMRGVVTVQRYHLRRLKAGSQRGGPALQHVLGQEQRLAVLVDGALGQSVNAPRRTLFGAHTLQLQRLLPQAKALALALQTPSHTGVVALFGVNGLHGRDAGVPLDDEGHRTLTLIGLRGDGLHQFEGTKARIGAHQQRCVHQASGHGQDALQVVLALAGRVLAARAQRQLQAIALGAQVGGQRAIIAINACVGAPYQLFTGGAVVHGKGVDVQRHVAAGQLSKVNRLAIDAAAQKGGIELGCQIKPVGRMGIHALTQRGARRCGLQGQRALEKGIGAKAFDGIEIVLAQAQQAQVGELNVAVGNARAHRELGVYKGVEVDAFEILTDKGQTGMRAEVVGEFLDNGIGHEKVHLLGERYMMAKRLISMGKQHHLRDQLTDSGG